jgi:outer membrane biosynthesis protein TonB
MRMGAPLSVVLHIAVAAAGFTIAPSVTQAPTPMTILPVDLLAISDTTNVAPAIEEVAEELEAPAETAAETMAPKPAPEPETEVLPAQRAPDRPPPAKAEPPRPPQPARPAPPELEDTLESILKSVETNRKPRPAPQRSSGNLARVEDKARTGVGDQTRMTVTVADFIRSQLIAKGCWADQDDMADARRLRAVIRVRFERDGRLAAPPELRDPARTPSNDPPMQIFVQRAFRSLNICSPFTVPPEYFEVSPPPWIDITFTP